MMTGPRVSGFTEGWAKPLTFHWGKAHYYVRDAAGLVVSKCGASRGLAGMLFREGNWERCKSCERALAAERNTVSVPKHRKGDVIVSTASVRQRPQQE